MDGKIGSPHYASFGPGDLNRDPRSGDQYFGLSEFIKTLTSEGPFISQFNITKAHRDTDINHAADIEPFRFDEHDLSVYDEIWLFGVAALGETDELPIDSPEITDGKIPKSALEPKISLRIHGQWWRSICNRRSRRFGCGIKWTHSSCTFYAKVVF